MARRMLKGATGFRALLCVALMWLTTGTGFAQGLQTGTLRGTVRDQEGLVLPGVVVTAQSTALQGTRDAVTDANGTYVIRGLPPGRYFVSFQLSGFEELRLESGVDLGQATELEAVMHVAGLAEQITVVAEPSTALSNVQGGANYRASEIDSLATPRTLSGIAELAPGLTNNTPNAGQVTIAGGFSYDNVFLVDGVDVNDNLFGDPDNLFIEDAIEETQVLTSGISAEYGRFSGGVINAVTKRGGDIFSGSFRTNLTNPSWTDETPFELESGTSRPSELSKVFEATLGGPVLRSRLWFFTAGRWQDQSESVALDQTAIQVTEKTKNTRWEGKLTGTIAANHTLQGSYLYNRSELTQRSFDFDIDPVSTVNPEIPNSLFGVNYRGVLGSRAFVEAQVSRKKYEITNSGGTNSDIRESPFISLAPFGLYNSPYFDATDPEERNNFQVTGSLSYFLTTPGRGSHDIKGGFEVYESTNTGGNSQTASGYVFFAPYLSGADGRPVVLPNGKFVPIFTPFDVFINNWQATRGASLDIRTTSFYLQDRWTAGRHLSFDLGVRYERVRSDVSSGDILGIDTDTLVPRLGMTYDPLGDGVWVLQASYAHYAGKYSEAQFSSNTTVGNPDLVQLLYVGPEGQGFDFAPGFDLANYVPVGGRFNASNVSFASSLSSPVNREWTLSVGRQLGSRGYAKVSYVNRNLDDIVEDFIDLTTGETAVERDGVVYGPFPNSVFRNTDVPDRRYQGLVMSGSYRVTPRWSLNGHWTVQLENDGNFEGEATNQPALSSEIGDYPEIYSEARHYPDGRLAGFQRHKVRAWTIYNVGLGRAGSADVSFLWRYDSPLTYSLVTADDNLSPVQEALGAAYAELPVSQTVYFGKRGSQTFESTHLFDLAVNYSIPVFRTLRPWIKFEVVNLFNNDTLLTWNTDVFQDPASPVDALGLHTGYLEGPTFGRAEQNGNYPLPRTFRVALGVRF